VQRLPKHLVEIIESEVMLLYRATGQGSMKIQKSDTVCLSEVVQRHGIFISNSQTFSM